MHINPKSVLMPYKTKNIHRQRTEVSHAITIDRSAYDDTAKMDTTANRHVFTPHTHIHKFTHKQFIVSKVQTSWNLTWTGAFLPIGRHIYCGCRDNSCPCRTRAVWAWHGTELWHWWGSWKLCNLPHGFPFLKFIFSSSCKDSVVS